MRSYGRKNRNNCNSRNMCREKFTHLGRFYQHQHYLPGMGNISLYSSLAGLHRCSNNPPGPYRRNSNSSKLKLLIVLYSRRSDQRFLSTSIPYQFELAHWLIASMLRKLLIMFLPGDYSAFILNKLEP